MEEKKWRMIQGRPQNPYNPYSLPVTRLMTGDCEERFLDACYEIIQNIVGGGSLCRCVPTVHRARADAVSIAPNRIDEIRENCRQG